MNFRSGTKAWGRTQSCAKEAHEEHVAIFQAIEEQAPEEVAEAMRTHLGNSLESMTEAFDGEETRVA